MTTLAILLSGLALGAPNQGAATPVTRTATESQPRSSQRFEVNRHPGQNGALTADQAAMAGAAWQYFQNNFQPTTCLYNSVDQYPSTTMWDVASSLAALVAAFEFQWIDAEVFDQRTSCLLASLERMPLYRDELPNKAYDTVQLIEVDYANHPGEIGASAIDLGRLLTWLAIVENRYPIHADAIDRIVLRWSFCNVVDDAGSLYGASVGPTGQVAWLQEGRLGYEEYAAAGFQLWGFDTSAASAVAPFARTTIQGVPILYDARDPSRFGAHNYVVTESYLLSGLEMNWDLATDTLESDAWTSDREVRQQAERVYKAQLRRWRETGTLTARTEHQTADAPYFVYDTVYSDGVAWNTLADTGKQYPELAAMSSKAALGMSVLFDTRYTDRLAEAVAPLVDPHKGVYEGIYEADGRRIESLTANTNGIILESLLYKLQGKLYRDNGMQTLWDRTPSHEYPGNSQCLPRSLRRLATDDSRGGSYETSRQITP